MGPRDRAVAAARDRVGGRLVERPHARVGAQDAHPRQVREHLRALADEALDLRPGDLVVVRIGDLDVGRAEDRDGVDGDHDVAVGRAVAAVDHRVGHPVVVDQHRALAGRHLDADVGEGRDLARPGARRGDHELGPDPRDRAGLLVAQRHLGDPVPLDLHADDALVGERLAAVPASVGEHRVDQHPRLDGAVRDAEGAADLRVERRLPGQEVRDLDLVAVHAAGVAVVGERLDVVVGVVGRRDEVAAGVLDARRRDPPQHAVLVDALAGGELVLARRSGRRSGAGRGTGRWSRCRSRCAPRAGT